MAAKKSKSGRMSYSSGDLRAAGRAKGDLAVMSDLPSSAHRQIPYDISRFPASAGSHKIMLCLRKAQLESRKAGQPVSFVVHVQPDGTMKIASLSDLSEAGESTQTENPALQDALAAARDRGRGRAAEILNGSDMLGSDAFAVRLGTTRVTVGTKRKNGQVLGLEGATRGFRYPEWQIDANGIPFPELEALHRRLNDAWSVYRFLVQKHGELDGLSGREALARGMGDKVLEVADTVARDFS